MNIVLWVLQVLLALSFVLAGFSKTFRSVDAMATLMSWVRDVPVGLLRFIGVAELLGGLGLILPAALRILPWLTVATALGLALVMLCAMIFHLMRHEYLTLGSGSSLALLVLTAFVVYGRLALVTFSGS